MSLPSSSESVWISALRQIPAPILLLRSETGVIEVASAAVRQLLELGDVPIKGKTTIELGLWADRLQRSDLMHELVQTGRLTKKLISARTARGRPLSLEISIEMLQTSEGNFFLVFFDDVSQVENLQVHLRSVRDQLALLTHGTAVGLWSCSPDSDDILLSLRGWELLGYGEANPKPPSLKRQMLLDEFGCETFTAALKALQPTTPTMDLQLQLYGPKGTLRWYRLRGSLKEVRAGSVSKTRVEGTIEDIHDTKSLELAQLRTAQRAQLALTAAELGYWEVFEDGSAIWDAQTYRLYGYDPGTSRLPKNIYEDALSEGERERTSRWMAKSLRYGLSLSIDFELRRPDGQVRILMAQGQGIVNPVDGRASLIGVNWDVTEQRKAKEDSLRYQRELSALARELIEQERNTTRKLAQALHDQLGQTLTAARLSVDFQQQVLPTEAGGRMQKLMSQAIEQVRGLLTDLRPTLLEERGLCAALDNEVMRALPLAKDCDVVLQCEIPDTHARWPTEVEFAFYMIAREAIANSVAHAQAHLVVVDISVRGRGLHMEVSDDGNGFSTVAQQSRPGHLGLIGMRERALAVDARLTISSTPGDGTRVQLMWEPKT